MDINVLMLSFIIVFMLHNLEEIFTVERWIQKIYPRIQNKVPLFAQKEIEKFKDMTAVRFAIVVFVLSIVCSALILFASLTEQYYLFLGLHIVFSLNIFTHPLQSLFLQCYTPGLWTTIILIIPYNIVFVYYFFNTGLFTAETIVASLVIVALFIPAFLLSHKIGERWSSFN